MSKLKLPYVLLQSPPIGPIALHALELAGYPPVAIIDDPKLSTDEIVAIIDEYQPTFLLVVGFGAILKQKVLDTVSGQVINIHPSYLPEYRGPAPVVQTILDAPQETGVTVIEIDKEVDHGPILAQAKQSLHGKETPNELYSILVTKGVELFLNVIDDYLEERMNPLPQNHMEASFTHFISKEDGKLDFTKPAQELEREVRAYQGWPRSWTEFEGKRLIIDAARIENGKLAIDKVQPEGKKSMTLKEFCAGKRITEEEFYTRLGIR